MSILIVLGAVAFLLILFVGGGLLGWFVELIMKIFGFLADGWSNGCGGCMGCFWIIFVVLFLIAAFCM
jgi:hypothetical protein